MNGKLALGLLVLAPLAAGCGTVVKRESVNTVQDLNSDWNDTDSRLVAQEMISDCLSRPWLSNATQSEGHTPTVIVGTVHNRSNQHIDTDAFIQNLQSELINSGKVAFVANRHERGEVREERLDQDTNASDSTRKANGHEIGADFMLDGVINTIEQQEGGQSIILYQTNLRLVNMETNQIVWNGQKQIKKYQKRAAVTW